MRASVIALLGTILLAGCAEIPFKSGPQKCELAICLLYAKTAIDSDHDGFADVDELLAGTDPYDPNSYPRPITVSKLIASGTLPSFQAGYSELVVLPTKTPFGSDVININWMPARKAVLSQLGLSDQLLSQFGLTSDQGFRIQIDHPSSGKKSFSGFRVSGIDAALISSGDLTATEKNDLMRAGILASKGQHGENDLSRIDFSTNEYGRNSKSVYLKWNNEDETWVIERGHDSFEIVQTNKDLSAGSDMKQTRGPIIKNADGSTTQKQTTDKEDYGTGTKTHSETVTNEKKNKDGSSSTIVTTTTTVKDKDGNLISTTTTKSEKTTDPDGTSFETSNTTTCDAEGRCTTSAKPNKKYIDPDLAQEANYILPTPTEMKRIVGTLKGSNTTPGPSQEGPVLNAWPIVRIGVDNTLIAHWAGDVENYKLILIARPRTDVAQPEVIRDGPPRPGGGN